MSLVVIGLSHHSTPVEVRERFVFSHDDAGDARRALRVGGEINDAIILSSCNRAEFYLYLEREGRGVDRIIELFAERAGLSVDQVRGYIYDYHHRVAVEHLFRVVTSLDSMIVGEAQIQGQVSSAYEMAAEASQGGPQLVGPVLSRLFQTALSVGGRVRSETSLGQGAASIPSAAVALAKKVFGSLRGRRALVLGAGEMGALAFESLVSEGIEEVIVTSRTLARAEALASGFGGKAIEYDELDSALASVEIIATATAAPHLVVTRELFDRAFPHGPKRQLLFVDIAIPRDVDPSIGEGRQVFLYDLHDLRQSLERRMAEVPVAEGIVRERAGVSWEWLQSRAAVPLIRESRGRAESVRRAEVERTLRRLSHLDEEDRAAVDQLTRPLLNKILHQPTVRLREAASNGGEVAVLHAARYLFELESGPEVVETRKDDEG